MENPTDDILLKNRSAQGCIGAGYRLYRAAFRRIFKATWLTALVYAVVTAVASALPLLVSPVLVLPGLLLWMVATIVFLYMANHRLKKCGILERTESQRLAWLRHLAMTFAVVLVSLIVVTALLTVTSLPYPIIALANWQAQTGVIYGDPLGMPSYVRWLSAGVFLVAGFIQAYVLMTLLFPFYYMGGALAVRTQEENNFKQKTA